MKFLFLNKALKFCIVPAGIGTLITTIFLTNISKPLYKLDSLTLQQLPDLEEEELTSVYVAPGGTGDGKSKDGQGGTGTDEKTSSTGEEGGGSRTIGGGDEEEGKKKGDDEEKGKDEDTEEEEEEESEDNSEKGSDSSEGQEIPEIISGGKNTLEEIIEEAVREISGLDIDSISSRLGDLYKLAIQLEKAKAAIEALQKKKTKD